MPRRFKPPWTADRIPGYASETQAVTATALTMDEARRLASNIAKLPALPKP